MVNDMNVRMGVVEEKVDVLEDRVDKMEIREEKKQEELNIISKAIVEIQVSNRLVANTLSKLESKIDGALSSQSNKWFKLVEKGLLVLAGIIGALLGVKIL